MARTWVKLFCTDWITGSIRKDEPIVRDVLTGLMALAGLGAKSNEGKVELIGGIPYELKQLAETLNVKQPDLETAIQVLSSEGRINVDKGIITILNWKKYQSEYERTKPYRVVEKVQPRVEKELEKEVYKDSIFALYESNIGMLTPMSADELKDWQKTYPEDWIKDAIKKAVSRNARNNNYIRAVLKGWQAQGRGTPKQESRKQKKEIVYE